MIEHRSAVSVVMDVELGSISFEKFKFEATDSESESPPPRVRLGVPGVLRFSHADSTATIIALEVFEGLIRNYYIHTQYSVNCV